MNKVLVITSGFFRTSLLYLGIDSKSVSIPNVPSLTQFYLVLRANLANASVRRTRISKTTRIRTAPVLPKRMHILMPSLQRTANGKTSSSVTPAGRKVGRRNGSS